MAGDWLQIAPAKGEVAIAVVASGSVPTAQVELLQRGFEAAAVPARVEGLDLNANEFDGCVRHLQRIGFRGVFAMGLHRASAGHIGEKFYMNKNSMGVANGLLLTNDRIFAQNTEIPSISTLISHLEPSKALVLGSGNAARSVLMALFDAGWKVKVWNRSALKVRPLQTLFARYGTIDLATQPDPTDCRLIVNCTPLGAKAGEEPPLLWRHVQPRTWFLDLVQRRVPTEFLRSASMRGLKTTDGREVAVEAAAEVIDWWLERRIDREAMRLSVGLRPRQLGVNGTQTLGSQPSHVPDHGQD